MKYKPSIVSAFFQSEGLPAPQFEVVFHPGRKFRWDIAWTEQRIAIECQGGLFTGGRHARGPGLRSWIEKHNLGATNCWCILYCEPKDLCTVKLADMVKQLYAQAMAIKGLVSSMFSVPQPPECRISADKTIETWGPYELHADGWYRLKSGGLSSQTIS